MRGASALGELLARHPAADVRVFVVWEPVIASDVGPPTDAVRAPLRRDPRVVELWDPRLSLSPRAVSGLAARARELGVEPPFDEGEVAWDFVALYPAGATWREPFPAPVEVPGTPVEKQLAPIEAFLRSVGTAGASPGDMRLVSDVMTRKPTAIRHTATVKAALATMLELDVRHLPVVNESHELVGMLSDRDLRGLPSGVQELDEAVRPGRVDLAARVDDVMSADVKSVEEEDELTDALELMIEHRIGAVPVVNSDQRLVGIVSTLDVLRVLHRELTRGE